LQGQARVLRAGREPFDFRPGLPLELFYDAFVWHPGVPHGQKAVGHVEQMMESACFTKSAGKLCCASCHDPHEKPPLGKQATHYRQRCLSCHTEMQCGVPLADRRTKNQDACTACHMPPSSTVDVVHVSITDHRILRDPKRERHRDVPPPRAGEPPLVTFHAGSKYIPREDRERDLALALMQLAGQTQPGPQREYLARLSVARLQDNPALSADPQAELGLASALRTAGRRADSLAVLEGLLGRQPRHEQALVDAGTTAGELDRPSEAAAYWRRAIELSPRRWLYHFQLASALADQHDWTAALAECATARRLNPMQTEVRLLEVSCLLESGRKDDARKAFDDLMILKPPREAELRMWFKTQSER
jgi:Flp pilus assembly protein TadD